MSFGTQKSDILVKKRSNLSLNMLKPRLNVAKMTKNMIKSRLQAQFLAPIYCVPGRGLRLRCLVGVP